MGPTLTDPLLGTVVDGRYEVISRIARGGMATVYLGLDPRHDPGAAPTVLPPAPASWRCGGQVVSGFGDPAVYSPSK